MFPFRRILFPTDFSVSSLEALPKAVEIAQALKIPIVLVHVLPVDPPTPWDVPPYADFGLAVMPETDYHVRLEQEIGRRLAATAAAGLPAEVERALVVRRGDPAKEIVAVAAEQGCDLIVMATHGWRGWRHLVFGSVAERILRESDRPVLVVRGPVRSAAPDAPPAAP